MFSADCLISMANGTHKPITSILRGDMIFNKFKVPTKVLKIHTYENQQSIRIQLNNGTTSFHVSPNAIVFCYYRTANSTLKSEYCTISKVQENNGYIKSDLKIFSPDSDVNIDSYVDVESSTLYSLDTSDNSQSYLVNKVIVSNIPSCY
jgi:hypothetical protein